PAVGDGLAGLGGVRPRAVGAVRGRDQELGAGLRAGAERQLVLAVGNRTVDDRCVRQRTDASAAAFLGRKLAGRGRRRYVVRVPLVVRWLVGAGVRKLRRLRG